MLQHSPSLEGAGGRSNTEKTKMKSPDFFLKQLKGKQIFPFCFDINHSANNQYKIYKQG